MHIVMCTCMINIMHHVYDASKEPVVEQLAQYLIVTTWVPTSVGDLAVG